MASYISREYLERDPRFTVAGEFTDGRKALCFLRGEQVDLRFAVEKNLDLNHFSGVASGKSGNVTFAGDPAASAKETVDKEGQSTEGEKEDSVYKVQTARLYHIAEAFLRTIREFE